MKDSEPEWADPRRSVRVWSEDDATAGCEGHETIGAAHRRVLGEDAPVALEAWDGGDAVFRLLPGGVVHVDSYPGNSEIRLLLAEGSMKEDLGRKVACRACSSMHESCATQAIMKGWLRVVGGWVCYRCKGRDPLHRNK